MAFYFMIAESQNIEWKQSWNDDYLKWIRGFANAQGGRLFIGKDDAGKVIGLKNAKKLLEELPNKIRDQLGLMPHINLLEEDGKTSMAGPYSLQSQQSMKHGISGY